MKVMVMKMSNNFKFGNKSMANLVGVHPDLIRVACRAIEICEVDFSVFSGVRTIEEQVKLIKGGYSQTYHSYHLWGLAIDLVPYIYGGLTWADDNAFAKINEAMVVAMGELGVSSIEWGFDLWEWDKAHYQMTGCKSAYDIREL